MISNNTTFFAAVTALALFFSCPHNAGTAPQKDVKAAKKRAAVKTETLARQRAVKDFRHAYRPQEGIKTVKIYHTGKVRNYSVELARRKIPAQVHRVAHIVQFDDCGIRINENWDVLYHRLETDWIFKEITKVSSTQLTRPKKKHPSIEDAVIKKLVSKALTGIYEDLVVGDITIQSIKSRWRLCVPECLVRTRVSLSQHDTIRDTLTGYECLFVSRLSYLNGAWEHGGTSCIYRGKEVADCHISTMCREISSASSIPVPTKPEASYILRNALANSHVFKQREADIESFTLLEMLSPENFGKKIPCVALARFVIDENRETTASAGAVRRQYVQVRAVFECFVRCSLLYSARDRIWEGEIEYCCPDRKSECSESCTGGFPGCTRLGEK
ncbi:MAG: hypothetical protein JW807_00220 [Spirochaetes bacterium]|nr:hypothetical protein [Spirochaetota bacterium]